MNDEPELHELRALLEAVSAERDLAVSALEAHQRQSLEQTRMLMEEQDRFVSRLLAAQERDVGKLRLELEEARTTAERLERKLHRGREGSERLEEELAKARLELDRLRAQRDTARAEAERGREAHTTLRARVERLEGNLALARSMLDDAMGETRPVGTFTSARPPVSPHRRLKAEAPRESGIRRPPRGRLTPPGMAATRELQISDAPLASSAEGTPVRSRPPR
jgi:septal ring factor EnvC (AmiA/AmiB activator)